MSNEFPEGAELWPGWQTRGGSMAGGGGRKVTWHITWDSLNPRPSMGGVAAYLDRQNFEPSILWDTETGAIIGMVPAGRSAYAVKNLPGGIETNRAGDLHVQIEVYFTPGLNGWNLFTDGPMVGLDRIMAWLDRLYVPRTEIGDWASPTRHAEYAHASGHMGHFQWPENDHSDPIRGTDIHKILATGLPAPHPPNGDDEVPDVTHCTDKTGRKWFFGVVDDRSAWARVFRPDGSTEHDWFPLGGVWTSGLDATCEADGLIVVSGRGGAGTAYQMRVYTDGGPPPPVAGQVVYFDDLGGHFYPPA